jgi:lysozyme
MNRELRNELIRDEGLRLEAYQDTVGLWTIGVGHLLGEEKRMSRITEAEAYVLLEADVREAEDIVLKAVTVGLLGYSPRYRALVNMAFNLGPRLFKFKKFLASVNACRWEQAGVEMMQSKWATQVKDRANRLRDMIVSG